MATSKAKKAKKPAAKSKPVSKPKTTAAKVDKKATVEAAKTEAKKKESKKEEVKVITAKKPSAAKEFFARKFDASENILTIFKDTKIIGAILGEIIGVMLITMLVLTLGLFNPLYLIFGYLIITLLVFRLSGGVFRHIRGQKQELCLAGTDDLRRLVLPNGDGIGPAHHPQKVQYFLSHSPRSISSRRRS